MTTFLLLTLIPLADSPTWTCRTQSAIPGSTCYIWHTSGGIDAPPTVPAGWTSFMPQNYATGNWQWQWAYAVRIPRDARPGTYQIANGTNITPIAVTAPNPRLTRFVRWVQIPAGNSLPMCQSRIRDGYNLELAPGLHYWSGSLNVPEGATIRSAGAWVVRQPTGEYAERMFVPHGTMTLDGLVLTHAPEIDSAAIVYLHQNPTAHGNITIRNCTIRGGSLAQGMPSGMLVEDCVFDRASTGQVASGSVWLRCKFTGHTRPGHHAFFSTGAEGVLIASCDWDATNRGIVLQTGACRGFVGLDLHLRNIRGGEGNAGECILMEAGTSGEIPSGQGMRDNAFANVWISDCSGPGVSLYGSGMTRNQFWDFHADVDNTAIMLAAFGGRRIDETQFHDWIAGGCLDLRGDVGRVMMRNVHFIARPQLPGNQGKFAKNVVAFNKRFPVWQDSVAKEKAKIDASSCGVLKRDGAWEEWNSH